MSRTITDLFVAELAEEAAITRRVLERVPEGRNDWRPHPRSMALGYLAWLMATMPNWVHMTLTQDSLDLAPVDGKKGPQQSSAASTSELLSKFDESVASAKSSLASCDDAHLQTTWRLLVAGRVVQESARQYVLRHSTLNHWVHHRGQLTVYLRLNEAPVPSIYGPTADEPQFK
jgi:uncharacterized damage-inducible protein DinB